MDDIYFSALFSWFSEWAFSRFVNNMFRNLLGSYFLNIGSVNGLSEVNLSIMKRFLILFYCFFSNNLKFDFVSKSSWVETVYKPYNLRGPFQ